MCSAIYVLWVEKPKPWKTDAAVFSQKPNETELETEITTTALRNWLTVLKNVLSCFVADCNTLFTSGFIFQQDDALKHTAQLMQDWIATSCPKFGSPVSK